LQEQNLGFRGYTHTTPPLKVEILDDDNDNQNIVWTC